MRATYVGNQYVEWALTDKETGERRSGVYTDVFLVKDFRLEEKNHEGQKAVAERVRSDIRKVLKDIPVGGLVEIGYDVGPGGKAVLASIESVA